MKTVFKINPGTQQAASLKIEAAQQMMRTANITKDEWLMLIFETGCAFVEQNTYLKPLWAPLLQNEQIGFWDWWLILWTEDDELLLKINTVNNFKAYKRMKIGLINNEAATFQFHQFLRRNKFINGEV